MKGGKKEQTFCSRRTSRNTCLEGRLSAYALRILHKLASGAKARRAADGGYRLSSARIPSALVQELIRRNLVAVLPESRALAITAPGVALVRRQSAQGKKQARPVGRAPDPYRAQHQVRHKTKIECNGEQREFMVDRGDTPLGWLASRKDRHGRPLLSPGQYEAGERLRVDFERAEIGSRLTQAYDGVPITNKHRAPPEMFSAGEYQLAAKDRVDKALRAVGPGLSDILMRVCCRGEGLEQAELGMGWPSRSAKVVLGIALDRLATFYAAGQCAAKRGGEEPSSPPTPGRSTAAQRSA